MTGSRTEDTEQEARSGRLEMPCYGAMALGQWFSTGLIRAPRGHWVTSGDIRGSHDCEREGAPGVQCAETRDAAQSPAGPGQLRRSPRRGRGSGHCPGRASVRSPPLCHASSPAVLSCHRRRTSGQSALQPGLRPAPRSHVGQSHPGRCHRDCRWRGCPSSIPWLPVPRALSVWIGASGATLAIPVPAKTLAWGWRWHRTVAPPGPGAWAPHLVHGTRLD